MHIRKISALRGPNIWSNRPVIEAWVDLGRWEDFPSHTLPGFNDRIMQWLPTMVEHRCSIGERGGFFQRMREGTWLGHVLEHVTLELQSLSHRPTGFGRARETSERGVYKVVVASEDPRFSEVCMRAGLALILAAVDGKDVDIGAEIRRLREVADQFCLGPSTHAIVSAAAARGIPAIRLTEGNLVQLGYGKAQRRIWTAETAHTGAIAEAIAQDKELTRKLLSAVGVPVPFGRIATTPEDAWLAAESIGLPVVVKPQDANHGRGVSIRLEDRAAVEAAYHYATREGSGVVVERFVSGTQYRVLVVGDRAVAAAGGEGDQVVGDGIHTIEQLVALANQNPERGEDAAQPLTTLVLDEISLELLRRQDLEKTSVPSAGRTVIIHYNGDLTVDETDRMHADVAAACVLAAQTIGLDVAGIDLIADDIGRPLEPQGAAIIEVNASPGLNVHLKPLVGQPRPVGEAIAQQLFREGESGRVPLVAIAGTNGKTLVATLIASMLAAAGRTVGRADSTGVRIGERWLSREDGANASSARRVLMNPFVDSIVLEVAEASVLEEGLAFDRCDVAVVTNFSGGDHLTKAFVEDEMTTLAKAVRAPVDVVAPGGAAVLNADDDRVVEMAAKCRGRVIYFSRAPAASPAAEALAEHLRSGGTAVVLEGDHLIAFQGGRREFLLGLARLSCAALGLPTMFIEDLLAACASGLALGLSLDLIRAGIERVTVGEGVALFEKEGALVLVTPGRNPWSLAAWVQALARALPERKLYALLEIPPDWRTQEAQEAGKAFGAAPAEVSLVGERDLTALVEAFASGSLAARVKACVAASSEAARNLTEAFKRKVGEIGPSDLLFVQPVTTGTYFTTLALLADQGMSRRKVSGLLSVENCR